MRRRSPSGPECLSRFRLDAFRASSAIHKSFVDTLFGHWVPSCFPLVVPCPPVAPFAPRGPSGRFPHFIAPTAPLRLPNTRLAPLWSPLGSAIPRCAASSLRRARDTAHAGPGLRHPAPASGSIRGSAGVSQVPGRSCLARRTLRPRWGRAGRLCASSPVAFRLMDSLGPTTNNISRLNRAAHVLRCLRFAARVAPVPRKTRFRPVASLSRAGFSPA